MLSIVTAFKAEAEPIIEGFSMTKNGELQSCPVYLGEHCQLIISGMGGANAFQATRSLLEQVSQSGRWLNFGVAGSALHHPGELVVGESVTDAQTGDHWLLPPVPELDVSSVAVLTVPSIEKKYSQSAIYEMEAAGFMQALDASSKTDQAVCLKLISDGPTNIETLTIQAIKTLISENESYIIEAVRKLRD